MCPDFFSSCSPRILWTRVHSLFLVTPGLSQDCSLYVKPAGGSRAPHQGCEDRAGRQDEEQGWASGSDRDSPCPNLQVRKCLGMNQTPAPQEFFCFATHELMQGQGQKHREGMGERGR